MSEPTQSDNHKPFTTEIDPELLKKADPDEEKRALIATYLEATNVVAYLEKSGEAAAHAASSHVMHAFDENKISLEDGLDLMNECKQAQASSYNETLEKIMRYWGTQFTVSELREIVAFHSSPIGRRLFEVGLEADKMLKELVHEHKCSIQQPAQEFLKSRGYETLYDKVSGLVDVLTGKTKVVTLEELMSKIKEKSGG